MKWFRPGLISVLVLAVIAGFFLKLIAAETFGVFATGLILYWFKARDEEKDKK